MHDYLVDLLVCPDCHGKLSWQVVERVGSHIESGEARCLACHASYPVRDGIGLFLIPESPRDDLWEDVDNRLNQYLREHDSVERRLMGVPLENLEPADQFFRALVLEERGDFAGAAKAEAIAKTNLYTPEYRECWRNQVDYVIDKLVSSDEPIVDLASGRAYLVDKLVRVTKQPIVVSDFSVKVLKRNRQWLLHLGFYEQVSLLAFDARRTPFDDGTIKLLTTNLGLPNIHEPGDLLRDLRRVVSGAFLAISHFYPEDDRSNAEAIHQAGFGAFLYKQSSIDYFSESGWQVEVSKSCLGAAKTTPSGVVLSGARIDAFPVSETTLEWCVLEAQ